MTPKQEAALKLALEALKYYQHRKIEWDYADEATIAAIDEALAEQPAQPDMNLNCKSVQARLATSWGYVKAEQPAQQQKEGFASPGGGYVPAIPRPIPLDWKLVPRKATPEMLKAMDECAQEGYDERLYAGMASSVYMAAWDASPVMGTLPEQPAQQQEPVAWMDGYRNIYSLEEKAAGCPEATIALVPMANQEKTSGSPINELQCVCGAVWLGEEMVHLPDKRPPASKPLTPREVELLDGMIEVQLDHAKRCDSIANKPMAEKQKAWDMERVELLRKLKAAHGIKGEE